MTTAAFLIMLNMQVWGPQVPYWPIDINDDVSLYVETDLDGYAAIGIELDL